MQQLYPKNISPAPYNMTITTTPKYKRIASILSNEELIPKNSSYSDTTQAPKERNHTDESDTDKNNSTNDQTLLIMIFILSSRFCSSRNGLTMVYWELI